MVVAVLYMDDKTHTLVDVLHEGTGQARGNGDVVGGGAKEGPEFLEARTRNSKG